MNRRSFIFVRRVFMVNSMCFFCIKLISNRRNTINLLESGLEVAVKCDLGLEAQDGVLAVLSHNLRGVTIILHAKQQL